MRSWPRRKLRRVEGENIMWHVYFYLLETGEFDLAKLIRGLIKEIRNG